MMKYSRTYGGVEPELIEGDVFKIIITVPEYGEQSVVERQATGMRKQPPSPCLNTVKSRPVSGLCAAH